MYCKWNLRGIPVQAQRLTGLIVLSSVAGLGFRGLGFRGLGV